MNDMRTKDDGALVIKALPLFPLKSMLLPEGALALKVFESRYLDMLTQCEKKEGGFGICLIKEGSEVGRAPDIYSVGTLVQITFWEYRKDGLLGISVKGEQKFKVLSQQVQKNELIVAEVELINKESEVVLPEQYLPMVNVLKKIFAALQHPYITLTKKYNDASWVGSRLSELLPLSMEKKQQLLELNEPMVRLSLLYDEMLNLGMLSE
ncbi:LON peptidase substrate-binding domain-containing protein [sulfur-oxidizing endosymbiont of Gigantopelta aegis]|uniref:LON peptidase substrate-binding domain-containing protein n=1 Tax=sulfur-oxidizing endosymbiont of Gigantopelta aegis TaxID=2794934 RepID=UPI0018DE580E|nr:LON peptidase substrate-binding domain-containing protein [sulfur-oxidizing endosymbiont of Gigantopelta aegis]